uniref:Uncharacterized protein n=1 Tax=Babesia bovis TaxID=5865 RepID=S6BF26_BABBO|nr:hypothetical protein [Babesia bovis]
MLMPSFLIIRCNSSLASIAAAYDRHMIRPSLTQCAIVASIGVCILFRGTSKTFI